MEICRLCFNSTSDLFIPLNIEDGSIQRKQLELIFPEIDLNVILSPVLCSNCSNTLENVYLLRNTWLECEGKLKNYLESNPNLKNPILFDVINEDNKSGILNDYFDVEETKNETTEIPEVELKSTDLNKDQNNLDLGEIKIEEDFVCNDCNSNENDCKCTQNSCSICFKKFNTQFKLERHKSTHDLNRPRPYVCDVCPKSYYNKYALDNHKSSHLGLRTFPCDQCKSSFTSKKNLYDHTRRTHLKEKETVEGEFRCDICLKIFSTLLKVKRHKANLHRARLRKHVCEVCGQSYFTKSALTSHQRTHKKPKDFNCEKCAENFTSKRSLTDHLKRVHDVLNENTIKEKIKSVDKEENALFECDLCNKKFARKSYVAIHIDNVHLGIKRKRLKKNLKCEYCGHTFPSDAVLRIHIRTHTGERPHKCDQCEKSFAQQSSLRNHRLAIHSDEKLYSCEYCGKKSSTKGVLLKHIQGVHIADTIPKNYKCTYCGKAFRTQSQMLSHVKWHTNDRQFNCDLCEKSFVNNYCLKKHRAIHFDEKKHKCEICGKGFHQKFNLKIHMKVHTRI